MNTHTDRPRGKSAQRPFRIPDDPYFRAVARAKDDGRPLGHVVTDFLAAYADGDSITIQHQARTNLPGNMHPGPLARCEVPGCGPRG